MKTSTRLIYDIASCPMDAGVNLDTIIKLYHEHSIAFYDSQQTKGCLKPEVVNVPEGSDLKAVDLSTKEGKELFNKISKN